MEREVVEDDGRRRSLYCCSYIAELELDERNPKNQEP